jgi:FtsZ-binding cell division protein ZapB
MNVKELQPTYTMRDMANMIRRVDELTRSNNALTKKLADTQAELEEMKSENAALTAQLFDMQADMARQMTTARILPISH